MTQDDRPLNGISVLVVEDDPMLLMELEYILADAGAEIVGVCHSVKEALELADVDGLNAAVLDFRIGRETIAPVARKLEERGTPFIFYTGQSVGEPSLAEWRSHPIVQKLAKPRAIVAAIAAALLDS